MVAAATSAANRNDNERARRAWSPDRNDHLIFQWVKMEGQTQGWVATQLGISQATVSRVVQRYERWQAHARSREGGRLDHSERLRAQRWLTFERNELLLASCLRIAGEMEGFVDTTKSTIRRPMSKPSQEREVSTQHATIDRSGVAARFLRLAFRINMEQLKLAELAEPPPAERLSAEEIAEQEREDAAIAEDLAAFQRRQSGPFEESSRHTPCAVARSESSELEDAEPPSTATDSQAPAADPDIALAGATAGLPSSAEPTELAPTAASLHNVHNLHNAEDSQFGASAAEPCSCRPQRGAKKNSQSPCIPDKEQAPWPGADRPKRTKRSRQTAAAT